MNLDIKNAIAWVFILLAGASSINMFIEARSYSVIYDSLRQLHFKLSKISMEANSSSEMDMLAEVVADNPVDYNGLKAIVVYYSIYFASSNPSSNASVFRDEPLARNVIVNQALVPHGVTLWNVTIALGPQDANSFSSFSHNHPEGITAVIHSEIQVSTHLFDTIGSSAQYAIRQSLPLA
jgi:hypothetical protein